MSPTETEQENVISSSDSRTRGSSHSKTEVEVAHSTSKGFIEVACKRTKLFLLLHIVNPIFFTVPQSPCSSGKNITGLPRQVRDLAADIHNYIQQWNENHVRGAKLIKQLAWEKAAAQTTYPKSIDSLTVAIYEITQNLKAVVTAIENVKNKMGSLCALCKYNKPMFISLSVEDTVNTFNEIINAYCEEYVVSIFLFQMIVF